MEKYALVVTIIPLLIGIYVLLIWNENSRRIKGSFWGMSRGIAKTALFRVKDSIGVYDYKESLSEKIAKSLVKDKYEMEVWSSCVILKNLSIVQGQIPLSADFILEQLMNNSVVLKPIYAEILSAYRSEHYGEAMMIFAEKVPARSAKVFAGVLNKLDQINPSELLEQMRALQETLAGKQTTIAMKKAERNSILVTALATVTIFCLLLNFAIVVVFMDTMAVLGQMF